MPLDLSLACPALHRVMGPPDPPQSALPASNPCSVQPHHSDASDAVRIVSQSYSRQNPVCACAEDCISSKCKDEELAIHGMALTLALSGHEYTSCMQITSSNSVYPKRACVTAQANLPSNETLNEDSLHQSEEEGGAARKKLRLSKEESSLLEERFREQSTLTPKQKHELARHLNLRPRQVEVWFQNRRARTKLKQTELDCELLKKCCASLTEENKRLQMEVAQLRALKVMSHSMPSHDLFTPMLGTTLTMCAQCERISTGATAPSSSTTTSDSSLHQAVLTSSPQPLPSPAPSS